MKVIVVGTGTVGTAVGKTLKEHGHDVVSLGRKSGDYQADISNMESLKKFFASIGPFDAVANAAGDVFPGPFEDLTDEQWAKSIAGKGMGQINVVRAALPHISDKGSFTLISGVLTDEYMLPLRIRQCHGLRRNRQARGRSRDLQDIAVRQNYRPLDNVLKLSHIARPRIPPRPRTSTLHTN
jgi:hypothetical protein